MKSKQRGMSFFGLLIVGVLVLGGGILAAQVFPTYLEYQAIKRAVDKAKLGGSDIDARAAFDKIGMVDDFKSITGKDLNITRRGDKLVVAFAYNKEIHMGGPVYLLLKYSGSSS